MATYNYKAFKSNNVSSIESGSIDAANPTEAREKLKRKGLVPTKLEEAGASGGASNKIGLSAKKGKTISVLPNLSLRQKIDFTTTLHALLNAGVPIVEVLVFIQNDAGNPKLQKVCSELKRTILAGATFATAIAKHPNIFDKVYVGLVKAGEDSGEMEDTIGRLIELLKKQQAIKSKVTGALMYPAFLIFIACASIVVLLTFVFPAFEGMFASMGGDLPLPTKICISAGNIIKNYWWAMLFGLAILGFGIYMAFTREASRRIIDTYSLKIPLLSGILLESNLSNFLAVLQVSYDAGIPIVECLRLAGLTLDNYFLRDNLAKAIIKVQQGVHLSTALRSTNAFPTLIMFLMSAGEQSGQLGDMLNHSVAQIDKRLDDMIDKMTKLIEPLMMLVMGGIVLFMALSLYMPLFKQYTMY